MAAGTHVEHDLGGGSPRLEFVSTAGTAHVRDDQLRVLALHLFFPFTRPSVARSCGSEPDGRNPLFYRDLIGDPTGLSLPLFMEELFWGCAGIGLAVVMPGHIGTDIVLNSRELLGVDLDEARTQMARRGVATDGFSDDDIQNLMKMFGEMFRDNAPVSAEEAATIILDGVRAGNWRILVGDDAHSLDEAVRADPENAYGEDGLNLGTITGS